MDNPSAPTNIVSSLLQIISRQLPFSAAEKLLDKNLHAYMDGKKIGNGRRAWFLWVRFLHHNADKRIANLQINVEDMDTVGDKVTVRARWSGVIDGQQQQSDIGTVVYQLQDGKIIAVWTHKKNYRFIYGNGISDNPVFFYWLLLRLWMYS